MDWIEEDRGYVTPCHIWQGAKNGRYGMVREAGKRHPAHRVAWIEAKGPIPDDWHIHHLCHQPFCIRVDHLEALTASEHRGRHPNAGRKNRFDAEKVHDIRTSPLSLKEMSMKYGVSEHTIWSIRRGFAPLEFAVPPEDLPERPETPPHYWNKGKTRLTAEAITDIRSSQDSVRQAAAKHGISPSYVSMIRRGKVLS